MSRSPTLTAPHRELQLRANAVKRHRKHWFCNGCRKAVTSRTAVILSRRPHIDLATVTLELWKKRQTLNVIPMEVAHQHIRDIEPRRQESLRSSERQCQDRRSAGIRQARQPRHKRCYPHSVEPPDCDMESTPAPRGTRSLRRYHR